MELLMAYTSYIVIFVVLLLSNIVQSSCPKGQMKHSDEQCSCPRGQIKHSNEQCCRPIMLCHPDHYVKQCTRAGGDDKCVKCQSNYRNIYNTSSFDIKPCINRTCNPDAVPISNEECRCDHRRGFVGNHHSFCTLAHVHCNKGEELTDDGICARCENFFFKDWAGFGYCRKAKDCAALGVNKTQDNLTTQTICESEVENDNKITQRPYTSTPSLKAVIVEKTTQTYTKKTTVRHFPITDQIQGYPRKPNPKDSVTQNSNFKPSMSYLMFTVVVLLVVIILGFFANYVRRMCNRNMLQNVHRRPFPLPDPNNENYASMRQLPGQYRYGTHNEPENISMHSNEPMTRTQYIPMNTPNVLPPTSTNLYLQGNRGQLFTLLPVPSQNGSHCTFCQHVLGSPHLNSMSVHSAAPQVHARETRVKRVTPEELNVEDTDLISPLGDESVHESRVAVVNPHQEEVVFHRMEGGSTQQTDLLESVSTLRESFESNPIVNSNS